MAGFVNLLRNRMFLNVLSYTRVDLLSSLAFRGYIGCSSYRHKLSFKKKQIEIKSFSLFNFTEL